MRGTDRGTTRGGQPDARDAGSHSLAAPAGEPLDEPPEICRAARAGACPITRNAVFVSSIWETWATLPLHMERFEIESEMLMVFLAVGASG